MSKHVLMRCDWSYSRHTLLAAERFRSDDRIACPGCQRWVKPFKSTTGNILLPAHYPRESLVHPKHLRQVQLRQLRRSANENDSHRSVKGGTVIQPFSPISGTHTAPKDRQ